MRAVVLVVLLATLGGGAAIGRATLPQESASPAAGVGAPPEGVTFAYVPRDTEVAPWEIKAAADGSGSYRQQGSEGAAQPIHVGETTWRRLTGGNATVFAGRCESRQKVAQSGVKTLSVVRNGGGTNCTFNYSDDAALNDAASAFIALAETMHLGEKLQHDHRFDRLALDADTDVLEAAVKDGRALEVENIGPVLMAMVDDDRVIDRVRRRAARLLQGAGVTVPSAAMSAR